MGSPGEAGQLSLINKLWGQVRDPAYGRWGSIKKDPHLHKAQHASVHTPIAVKHKQNEPKTNIPHSGHIRMIGTFSPSSGCNEIEMKSSRTHVPGSSLQKSLPSS